MALVLFITCKKLTKKRNASKTCRQPYDTKREYKASARISGEKGGEEDYSIFENRKYPACMLMFLVGDVVYLF